MGGVFEFSKQASANLREKDDVYNTTIGAFLGGAVIGLRCSRSTLDRDILQGI